MTVGFRSIIVILAAGASARFGSPKALAPWQGETLLGHAVRKASAVEGTLSLIVLGAHAEKIRASCGSADVVLNPAWADGMGTSVACGARAARHLAPETLSLILWPIDQPLVTPYHLAGLIDRSIASGRAVFTGDGPTEGPPVAVPRRLFPIAENLKKNEGLKALLDSTDKDRLEGSGMLADIDTPDDLDRLTRQANLQRA